MPGKTKLSTVQKYLTQHAEPEARASIASLDSETRFGQVVTIPSLGEGERLLTVLESLPSSPRGPNLVVVVLNARESAPPEHHAANDTTRKALAKFSFSRPHDRLIVIDRATPGSFLPEKQGVGLARKVGADFALAVHLAGQVESDWLCCTDADAVVPSDYFDRLPASTGLSAVLYPFAHLPESSNQPKESAVAIVLYETFLRYQLLGLHHAGSPYAFHTVGSTVAVSVSSYAAVRGFPKKMAGEDFYFLNKLAKVGTISPLSGDPILLAGRVSDRVPFGTGKAMGDLLDARIDADRYSLPNPLTFEYLRRWVAQLETWVRERDRSADQLRCDVTSWAGDLQGCSERDLLELLDSFDTFETIAGFLSSPTNPARTARAIHGWFDAFKTMMFLHGLRDRGLGDLPYWDAISSASFLPLSGSDGTPIEVLDTVTRIEEERCRSPLRRASGGQ